MSRYTGEISASQKLDSLNTSIVIPPVVIPPLGKTITSNSKKEQKNKEKKRKKKCKKEQRSQCAKEAKEYIKIPDVRFTYARTHVLTCAKFIYL